MTEYRIGCSTGVSLFAAALTGLFVSIAMGSDWRLVSAWVVAVVVAWLVGSWLDNRGR